MNSDFFLSVWCTCLALQLGFAVAAFWQTATPDGFRARRSLYVSAAASLVPLVTLCLFIRVFVIGRSSNVAQFAGDDGFRLWALWADEWLPLLFCNFVVFVSLFAVTLIPPWRSLSSSSRVAALLSALCALYALLRWYPDA